MGAVIDVFVVGWYQIIFLLLDGTELLAKLASRWAQRNIDERAMEANL